LGALTRPLPFRFIKQAKNCRKPNGTFLFKAWKS
jgi:hypothetical protein